MNSTECISLASSLLKTRGTPGFFGQLVRQPFLQLNREYHDPCEPRHLSWQWRVKDSPDVQRCSKLCLKKKACPKKRFFPRFKKSFIYNDIFACDPPKEKKKTWGEYLSFLLPDDATSKPQMATCRKMLEHRRRKCMEADNYSKCVQGECWPLPTEWYGQGVLHISELALTRPPYKPVESVKPCPLPAHLISKCAVKKLPVCPGNDLFCLEGASRKMPYSQFKGADTDGGPPSITLRCPIKYVPEMMPDKHQDRHYKLSCKTYGDFKNVECPPQMFNRYMDVDFNSKNLLPIPTTMPGYTPQREVKKGVCGRQTLLRPPSARNFSTGRAFMTKDYPEFIKMVNTSHLQPGRSAICFDKLIERAGMDADLLNKPVVQRQFDSAQRVRMFTEKELEKHELEARLAEETAEEKQKRIDNKKSKLQMLIEKQNKENDKKQYPVDTVKSVGNIFGDSPNQPFGGHMVDLEEVPYQRSKFHTSARRFARKDGKKSSGQEDEKICSGCPGIRGAEQAKAKGKTKCSPALRGGVKGRCKVNRAIRPEDRLNPLALKCKQLTDSPCMRPRSEPCLVGVATRLIHLTPIPSQPLKERIIFPTNGFLMNRDIKASFSQQSKDLLDQCCDQLEQLKKQIESMKASKEQPKDEAKEMLDQCCEQMDQLKKQLASLKKDKENLKNDPDAKELLDQCCEQQEDLKKQIEALKKSKDKKKEGSGKENDKKTKKDDPCEEDDKKGGGKDEGKSDKKREKKEGSQNDPCEKSAKGASKKEGGEEGGKKETKSYEPCKKTEQKGLNCKKIKDKKEKAEECAKYLQKQNDKLKKELEELKKKQKEQDQQKSKGDKKNDPCANRKKEGAKGDDCENMKKEKKKAEETVKGLIKENEKLKKEMATIKQQMSKSGNKKKSKNDKCVPSSVCNKKKESKKEPAKPPVDKDLQRALEECMKKCSRKAKREQIKKQVKAEKEKCKEELNKKKRELMSKNDDDGNVVATFLQSVCCKLQELAQKTKKKKPKC